MTKKLVIIDDSSTQLNILKTLFTNNGWEVCGVQSAKIGYEIIFDFAPDLIITDAIMPLMGGFQLIKLIRQNELISKIPVIVYSILNETNAKFYIKEELSEYFLRKENNQDELLQLAQKIVEKYPLDKEYKDEILRAGLKNYLTQNEPEPQDPQASEENEEIQSEEGNGHEQKEEFNIDEFRQKIKRESDFSWGDEKNFSRIFSILYDSMKYDLAILNVFSFENKENKAYFDIRNIILAPILRNSILNKFQAKLSAMYKKYAPNLDTMVNESEFLSKIEFNFEYKDENIANFAFYSREKLKWEDEEITNSIKEVLYNFSKARYIQRITQNAAKEDPNNFYKKPKNKFEGIKNDTSAYFGIIQINNFSDLAANLQEEELDIINSKISEAIIECLDKDEQVYKNDEDEYNIVIFAKDEKHAKYRFKYILSSLEEVYKADFFIGVASCNIDNNFNIVEAQKLARQVTEEAFHQDSVVIYNVR